VLNYNYNILNNASSAGDPFSVPVNLGDVLMQKTNSKLGFASYNSQKLNMGSELYAIICSANNKIYFEASGNVVTRLGMHFDELLNCKHECKEMQDDWNKHCQFSFFFFSLSVGQQWSETIVWRQAETKLVLLNKDHVYNKSIASSTSKKPSDCYCKIVSIKNAVDFSIVEAFRQIEVSETHIRRLLRDSRNTDWQYVDDVNNTFDNSLIINAQNAKKVK
jgi:hypothetical protein